MTEASDKRARRADFNPPSAPMQDRPKRVACDQPSDCRGAGDPPFARLSAAIKLAMDEMKSDLNGMTPAHI
jgi:hypothetical protein